MNNRKGFSLVEVILTVSLLSVVLIAMSSFVLPVVKQLYRTADLDEATRAGELLYDLLNDNLVYASDVGVVQDPADELSDYAGPRLFGIEDDGSKPGYPDYRQFWNETDIWLNSQFNSQYGNTGTDMGSNWRIASSGAGYYGLRPDISADGTYYLDVIHMPQSNNLAAAHVKVKKWWPTYDEDERITRDDYPDSTGYMEVTIGIYNRVQNRDYLNAMASYDFEAADEVVPQYERTFFVESINGNGQNIHWEPKREAVVDDEYYRDPVIYINTQQAHQIATQLTIN